MVTRNLTTLSDRIRNHKQALVSLVKPPICTERAQAYTEAYHMHADKPVVLLSPILL